MTRDDVQTKSGQDVPRETFEKLSRLVEFVEQEARNQNLVARDSLDNIWNRHIIDSIQLIAYSQPGVWMDLGTGAGFPGMVIAAFGLNNVVLVEERKLRHRFLSEVGKALDLPNVIIIGNRLERIEAFEASVISARAFAPLNKTLELAGRFSSQKTRWILPKGKKALDELASLDPMWHGDFRLERSVTDPDSSIIIAENVMLRG